MRIFTRIATTATGLALVVTLTPAVAGTMKASGAPSNVADITTYIEVPASGGPALAGTAARHTFTLTIAVSRLATVSRAASALDLLTPMVTVNLGLDTNEAKGIQILLYSYGLPESGQDGQLGTQSWMAMQRFLKDIWGYTGAIDGIVGTGTVTALQRWLQADWAYTGAIDGIAGPGTQAAFRRAGCYLWTTAYNGAFPC